MASPIDQELAALVEDFDLLGDWEAQIQYVIDLGRGLPPLAEGEYDEANKVRGCASQVWLITEKQPEGTLVFRGDSDAHLVKGLIAVLLKLYSGRRPTDILAFDAKAGFERLGLANTLTPQRSNGLASMINRIRSDAERAPSH